MIQVIGSDVTQLRETPFTTGVQRVMVETHKSLSRAWIGEPFKLRGFSTIETPGERYLENPYLAEDPVLSTPLATLGEIDLALLLDLNLALSFREILLLKKAKKLPVISLIHDIIPIHNPQWFPGEQIATKRYFREFLQKTLAISDHLVVCSKKVKDDIDSLGWKLDRPIHVFPLGASQTRKKSPATIEEIPTVIYVCTLEPRKGHMDLLGAFEILRKRGFEFRLEIVGRPGWLCKEIIGRITSNPEYGTYLKWHYNLSDEGVADLFGRAKLSIAASFDEGFGLGVEEALAREVVVLARKIPVFEERQNPNLYFFDGGEEELAAALISTLERDWIELKDSRIRTMSDFAHDIDGLIRSQF